VILGTAGHIDHGKTSLVRALTGVDTDRLPEEKRRGITIELGFAPLAIEGVGTVGIVDVPGHEAFIRTMLAGATGVDLALLVVAADEGLMPQTREHLAILGLLGVAAGVVAITKCDLADAEWIQLVEDDVRAAISATPLAGARVVRCSSLSGAGLDDLRGAIGLAARAVPLRRGDDFFRMPVDRVFTVRGTGTVVTGTVWSGRLSVDAQVTLAPAGVAGRVRGLESHGAAVPEVASGARAAIALGGVDRAEIDARGAMLVVTGDPWAASRRWRADVALLDGAAPIGPRTRVRLHFGTAEVGARIVAAGGPVTAGRRVSVRVALDEPLVARAGDRFVLRSASPAATIGGGIVTDPAPPTRRVRPWPEAGASDLRRLEWMLDEAAAHGLVVRTLPLRLGVRSGDLGELTARANAVRAGERLFSTAAADSAAHRVATAVDEAHRSHPLDPGLPLHAARAAVLGASELAEHAVAALVTSGALAVRDGIVARAGWVPGGGGDASPVVVAVRNALRNAGSTPPSVDELVALHGRDALAALKLLASRQEAVQVASDRYYSTEALTALTRVVHDALAGSDGLTASELREKTGLTRKYLIPFLEYCDRRGLTIRRGDVRTLGR
jgi:selenocysteine-specific elongation factor